MSEPRTPEWYMEKITEALSLFDGDKMNIQQSSELHSHIGRLIEAATRLSGHTLSITPKHIDKDEES